MMADVVFHAVAYTKAADGGLLCMASKKFARVYQPLQDFNRLEGAVDPTLNKTSQRVNGLPWIAPSIELSY
jgi:hypothetical protein